MSSHPRGGCRNQGHALLGSGAAPVRCVNGDGVADLVAEVAPGNDNAEHNGCVVSVSTPAGFVAAIVAANIGSRSTDIECRPAVVTKSAVFLTAVMISGCRDFGPDCQRAVFLAVATRDGKLRRSTVEIAQGEVYVGAGADDAGVEIRYPTGSCTAPWDPATELVVTEGCFR